MARFSLPDFLKTTASIAAGVQQGKMQGQLLRRQQEAQDRDDQMQMFRLMMGAEEDAYGRERQGMLDEAGALGDLGSIPDLDPTLRAEYLQRSAQKRMQTGGIPRPDPRARLAQAFPNDRLLGRLYQGQQQPAAMPSPTGPQPALPPLKFRDPQVRATYATAIKTREELLDPTNPRASYLTPPQREKVAAELAWLRANEVKGTPLEHGGLDASGLGGLPTQSVKPEQVKGVRASVNAILKSLGAMDLAPDDPRLPGIQAQIAQAPTESDYQTPEGLARAEAWERALRPLSVQMSGLQAAGMESKKEAAKAKQYQADLAAIGRVKGSPVRFLDAVRTQRANAARDGTPLYGIDPTTGEDPFDEKPRPRMRRAEIDLSPLLGAAGPAIKALGGAPPAVGEVPGEETKEEARARVLEEAAKRTEDPKEAARFKLAAFNALKSTLRSAEWSRLDPDARMDVLTRINEMAEEMGIPNAFPPSLVNSDRLSPGERERVRQFGIRETRLTSQHKDTQAHRTFMQGIARERENRLGRAKTGTDKERQLAFSQAGQALGKLQASLGPLQEKEQHSLDLTPEEAKQKAELEKSIADIRQEMESYRVKPGQGGTNGAGNAKAQAIKRLMGHGYSRQEAERKVAGAPF